MSTVRLTGNAGSDHASNLLQIYTNTEALATQMLLFLLQIPPHMLKLLS